jgi:hypothetical protein
MAWFKLISRIVIEIKLFHYFSTVYFTKTLGEEHTLALVLLYLISQPLRTG